MTVDYITELDVFDAERAAVHAFVRCDGCDHGDEALHMILQAGGEYLCPACDYAENCADRRQR